MAVKIVFLSNINNANGPNFELGFSDGVTSTFLDIFPGDDGVLNNWSFPHYFTILGGNVLFEAKNAANGRELWISDGTAIGTHLLKDINTVAPTATNDAFFPGSAFAIPTTDVRTPLVIGSTMYFSADDGAHGQELWKTDGTAINTVQVKDINTTGTAGSNPNTFVNLNGTLYFVANDGVNGTQIWKSNGTDAGTTRVTDLADPAGSSLFNLVVSGNRIYFRYNDGSGSATAEQIYFTDGTFATEQLLAPSHQAFNGIQSLTDINGTLYFTMNDNVHGFEMWKSNGTDAGTGMVADIFDNGVLGPGAGSSQPFNYFLYNGEVYFAANDDVHGAELWKTNGTAAGTTFLGDINTTDVGGGKTQGAIVDPFQFVIFNNELYFGANDGTGPGKHHTELWKTNGGAPTLVADLVPGALAGSPTEFQVVGGLLYFGSAASAAAPAGALFKYDGVNPPVQITGDYNFASAHEPFAILNENTPPVQHFNTGTTVNEGAATTILNAQLDFDDAQESDAQITYTVTAIPTNGTLFRNAIALGLGGTFTQADIVGNLLSYTHDGSETTSDSFGFSVSDGIAPAITGQTFAITVTPQNDVPVINSNGGGATANINVPENSTAVTTVTVLDPDGPSLSFSIVGGSDAGKFEINAATGVLKFISAPNFEVPGDSDANNTYIVKVQATDGLASDEQTITVTVTDVTPELADRSDFNADGFADIFWQLDSGALALWEMNGTQIAFADFFRSGATQVGRPGADWRVVDTGDFNGDARTDVLWRTNSGALAVWEMDGNKIKFADYLRSGTTQLNAPGPDWHALGALDANGDSMSDILWRTDSGALAIWQLDGTQLKAADYLRIGTTAINAPGADWNVVGTGDFDGDGKDDLLWQTDSGALAIWFLDGTQIKSAQYLKNGGSNVSLPAPDWNVADIGDFDGDGKSDILWRIGPLGRGEPLPPGGGGVAIWEMDGNQIKFADYTRVGSTIVGAPGPDWHLIGAADYNGDNKDDLLWQTDSGALAIWQMDGTKVASAGFTKLGATTVGVPGPDWHVYQHQFELF